MEKLSEGDQGFLGELEARPNPEGPIFRSTYDSFEIMIEAVIEMDGDDASEEAFAKAMKEQPVTGFRSNSVAVDYPVVVEPESCRQYPNRIREAE